MYVRFALSLRNVEDLLHERGIDVRHETIRFWWNRFGPMFAAEIRRRRVDRMRAVSTWRWRLDEVFVKVNGERRYLWRGVDHKGEVLEAVMTKRRDKSAALKLLKKLSRRYRRPAEIVTDGLSSYAATFRDLGVADKQATGRWLNNRIENSHQPFRRRERAMLRFRRMRSLQMFTSVRSSVHNHFNLERHLYRRDGFKESRTAALAEWRRLGAAGRSARPRQTKTCAVRLTAPTHRHAVRITNLLERLFVEERRRLKIIPNAFGERPVLKLMFGAMTRAAEDWRSIRFSDFERRQIATVRKDLDAD